MNNPAMTAESPKTASGETKPLSAKQKHLFHFILRYLAENGAQPSGAEMMVEMGVKSPNAITCLLKGMQKKGHIQMGQNKPRALKISDWATK